MNRDLLRWSARFLIAGGAAFALFKVAILSEEPVALSRTVAGSVVVSSPSGTRAPSGSLAKRGAVGAHLAWSAFQAKYGHGYEPAYSPEGCIESVRSDGTRSAGVGDFDSSEPQQAIRRAREIVADLKPILCMEGGLGSPLARGNSASVQVSFHQWHHGLPVAPRGNLTLDIGSQGELIGLFSNPSRFDRIVNERKLSEGEAQARVLESLEGSAHSLKLESGGALLWVAPDRTARYAYRYAASGRELVIDAQSGAVLSGRDLRHN